MVSLALSFVALMQLISGLIAAYLRKPKLALVAYAIVTGVAAAAGMFPMLPSADATWLSVGIAAFISICSLYLTNKSMRT